MKRKSARALNTPGTIDADYRGEVKVLLINHGQEPFTIRVETLDDTARGEGGFGSTGTA